MRRAACMSVSAMALSSKDLSVMSGFSSALFWAIKVTSFSNGVWVSLWAYRLRIFPLLSVTSLAYKHGR